ncbi:MAG TPA: CHC2 zinc finger domain-containing protein [Pirellulales bacterium]
MATIEKQAQERSPETRVLLRGISWEVYESLRDNESNNHLRMTYDRGTLEIMSPSDEHEWVKRLIGRMIEAITEELRIPVRSLSATTWRRRDIDKGLEADECYFIRSHPKIRHGPCPVHGSTSPGSRTFSVNLDTGRYYCHKCQSHGHALELWAAVHKLAIYEAALELCRAVGRDVPWINRW